MNHGDLAKRYLKDYADKTEPLLENYFDNKIKEALSISKIPAEVLKRFLEVTKRGKKIRGALMCLGYDIAGGKETEEMLDASIMVEIFHAGILVHDDIMDEDSLRRGLPTIHKQFEEVGKSLLLNTESAHYGESMAINTGDVSFYLSFDKLANSNFPPKAILKAIQIYTDYVLRLVHGQILDVTNISMLNLTEADILKVLKYKTAEYTGVMPMLMGAALAGSTSADLFENITQYGLAFGWAFQIQDDILGIFSKEEEMGKPIGSDLREGKNTLLMLYLSRHSTPEQRAFQKYVMGNKNITKDDVEKIREMLKSTGAYDHVMKLGWDKVEEGKSYIPKMTNNKHLQELLTSLITYMMERAV